RNRPGLQDPAGLEAEVVVQGRGVVLLDDESPAGPSGTSPGRLGGVPEVALAAIGLERILLRHDGSTRAGGSLVVVPERLHVDFGLPGPWPARIESPG